MGLFKSKYDKALDEIIARIDMNMSNNYKDAAQSNFTEFEKSFTEMKESGLLKEKSVAKYGEILENYRRKLEGYTHKDQKPYWH
ncbi:MAG: hypothetical protein MJ119_08200 [Lachnospiraceae bacterium]|nr:hypothetical protein [Lachnospiraceae bacterium]